MAESSKTYRPEVDGLRALSVVSVLLFHAELGVRGGYVGVDVFFVISGYLITGLLLKDFAQQKFSLAAFWERRVRRIMPPLAVVVLCTLAAGWLLLLAEDFKELGQSAVAQALLVSNIYFWRESGYFEQASDLRPLLHTWSLAVEEQFYLFFPLVLMLLKKSRRLRLVPVLLIAFILSFTLSVYWSHTRPEAGFYLLPTRAWELLLGALLALAPATAFSFRQKWPTQIVGAVGLLMILGAVFGYDAHTRFPGVAALLPCLGAALVIGCGPSTWVGKGLSLPLMTRIGLISYSLYLWHWPLLVFARYWSSTPLTPWQCGGLLLVSLILAALTWKWVEQPFRRRRVCVTRRSIYAFAGVVTSSALLLGVGIHHAGGFPSRIPSAAQVYADGVHDHSFRKEVSLLEAQSGDFLALGASQQQPVEVFVWGDSHAMSLLPVVDHLCREKSVRGMAAVHYQTPPFLNYISHGGYSLKDQTPLFGAAVLDFIRSNKVPKVILAGAWDYYINEGGGSDVVRAALLVTLHELNKTGVRVWVVRDVPLYNFAVPRRLAAAVLFGGGVGGLGLSLEKHRAVSLQQHRMLDSLGPELCAQIEPADVLSDSQGICRIVEGGRSLYVDGGHLSNHGAMLLRPLFVPVFDAVAAIP